MANFDYIGVAGEYPFRVTGGFLRLVSGNELIEQSIGQILTIAKGSIFMTPGFGSNLFRLLHNPTDIVVISAGETFIVDAIQEWEGRVDVIDVTGSVSETTFGLILFRITYRVKATNEVNTFVWPFYRELQN